MPDSTAAAEGLTEVQARARLARDGPNSLPSGQHTTLGAAILAAASQPMVLLLLACTVLYALLGSVFDALMLGISIVAVAGISVYQELRTQRVLEALRALASPRSTVVRDGIVKRISSHELVVGDRLIVAEGDRLACDATLVEAHGIRVDESLLTGESAPVDKCLATPGTGSAGSDTLYAGTLIVQGDGVAMVSATAARTELGRIGGSLSQVTPRTSRLHAELKRLVWRVAVLAAIICVLAAVVFAWRDGSWSAGALVGLTLAMSIVPEEFAVVWTVMLALGAWRLAQLKVLTRQPQAIEALGTATVLCVDKTGTMTRNRMAVAALHDGAMGVAVSAEAPADARFDNLLRIASLASVREGMEPMDQAIFRLLPAGDAAGEALRLVDRRGVAPGHPFVVQAWCRVKESQQRVAIKGAPEAVLARCVGDPQRLRRLEAQARTWSAEGLRIIAVAHLLGPCNAPIPATGYEAAGLIAFQDPLRDDVPAALRECRSAGVRVVMITGDSPVTALAIARAAGLVDASADQAAVMTGEELTAVSDERLEEMVNRVAVFARVAPAQKLRIVQALQRRGEVVAMTGDGVNDGPALRAADIGVAMGERGTDVAREAASLVLLDDRFGSLVDGVRGGRRIFLNLRKALGYLFAVHVPIIGLSLLPLLGGPMLLLPLHVVLLELIIDPACSLVFEAEPAPDDVMRQPPRSAQAALFDLASVVRAIGIGLLSLAGVAAVQWAGQRADWSDDALRLAGLTSIVVANIAMLVGFRTGFAVVRRPNAAFDALLLGVCVFYGVILLSPPVAVAFGFPSGLDLRWVLAAVGLPAGWSAWRFFSGRVRRPPGMESESPDASPG